MKSASNATAKAPHPAGARRRSTAGGARRSGTLLVVAVAFAVTFVMAVYLATQRTAVSIYDEGVHFDYIYKLLHGGLPQTASVVSPETVWEVTCRGGVPWLSGAHCQHLPPTSTPVGGVNYILPYFPFYYGLVAPFAALLHAVGVDLYTACRLVSCFLYAAGAALLTWSLIRLHLPRVAALGVGLGIMAVPSLMYQGSTITPDSMWLLAGSAGLFVVSLNVSWERRVLFGAIAGTLVALVKPNFLPVAGITVLLAILAPLAGEAVPRIHVPRLKSRQAVRALVALAAPVVVAGAWQVFRSHDLAPGQTSPDGGLTESLLHTNLSLSTLILDAARMMLRPMAVFPFSLTPAGHPMTPPAGLELAVQVIGYVVFGGAIVSALAARGRALVFARTFAVAGVGGLVISALYMPTTFYLAYHATGTQPRYAMPMIPLCAAAVALATGGGRVARWILCVGGVGFALYMVWVMERLLG